MVVSNNMGIPGAMISQIHTSVVLVSICIPVYNSASYLAQAIESALSQSYPDFEVLIVDDCSTDGSTEIAAEYEQKDMRIRFVKNESNRGMVGNWNYCLELAQGTYIRFLFGDDYFVADDALARQVARLESHPEVSLISSARLVVDEQGRVLETWQGFRELVSAEPVLVVQACLELFYRKEGKLKFGCLKNLIGEPSAVMFRKSQAMRGFNADYRQLVDLEMWFHLLRQGHFSYIAEPLVAFRRHDAQQTVVNTQALVHIGEYLALVKENTSFAYPSLMPPFSTYVLISECYRIVKLNKRDGFFTPDVVRVSLNRVISPLAYRLTFPLYLLLLPFYKLAVKVMGGWLTRYACILPDNQHP